MAAPNRNERQTVAGAYARIDGHEELCAERYKNIHDTLNDMKAQTAWTIRLVVGLVLAVTGWLAVQLWQVQVVQHQGPPSAVAISVPVAPK